MFTPNVTGHKLSRALQRLHAFPQLAPGGRFSRAWANLHIFPGFVVASCLEFSSVHCSHLMQWATVISLVLLLVKRESTEDCSDTARYLHLLYFLRLFLWRTILLITPLFLVRWHTTSKRSRNRTMPMARTVSDIPSMSEDAISRICQTRVINNQKTTSTFEVVIWEKIASWHF